MELFLTLFINYYYYFFFSDLISYVPVILMALVIEENLSSSLSFIVCNHLRKRKNPNGLSFLLNLIFEASLRPRISGPMKCVFKSLVQRNKYFISVKISIPLSRMPPMPPMPPMSNKAKGKWSLKTINLLCTNR